MDILFVIIIACIVMAMAVPAVQNIGQAVVLGEAQRSITNELNHARMLAVSTNRPVRVRFNCPLPGYFRTVELVGTPTVNAPEDSAPDRCAPNKYPYPPDDTDPLTRPNHDGPPRKLDDRVKFGTVQTIEFWPDGTAHYEDADVNPVWAPIPVAGIGLTLTKGAVVKTVTVNGLGKIEAK